MNASSLPLTDPRYLREIEAADRVGLAPSTLTKMRSLGSGPPFVKVGRAVRYHEDDLNEWLTTRTLRSQGGGHHAS